MLLTAGIDLLYEHNCISMNNNIIPFENVHEQNKYLDEQK